ncbi:MAG: response regulator [Verrucomicrobia bacterium]|nr:response regulator [Verrucomicrobiota bacterium]
MLLIVTAASFQSIRDFQDSQTWVHHAKDVLGASKEFMRNMVNVEIGQRSFLLTGNEMYVEMYNRGNNACDEALKELKNLVRDDPAQRQRLLDLERLTDQRTDFVKRTIEIKKTKGQAAALDMITTGMGSKMRENIRALVDKIEAEENHLLKERFVASNDVLRKTEWTIVGGSAIACVIVLIAAGFFFTEIGKRERMEIELAKAHDAAQESTKLKSEFLANMSHEIRTPMNGVIGMTGLLSDTHLTAEQRHFVEVIRTSGDTLLTVINDILDFSKIEAGMLEFEKVDFNLNTVAEGAVELFIEQARQKKIELLLWMEPETPRALRGDPTRIRQVLTNLLNNAIKFTENGEVILKIRPETDAPDRATIRFEVKDTGPGIAPEVLERLSQPFMQGDASTTRKHGGTGLGLAISRSLIEMMGGQMAIQSAPSKGSTFSFMISFEKQSRDSATISTVESKLTGLRVLVVDDNATNRKIVHHFITSWRMRNGTAASAAEGLEILRREAAARDPYDIAILDVQMPEMSGLDLARVIRADPLIAPTRLVILSSFGQRANAEEVRRLRIAAWLIKPVTSSRLFDCLVTAINTPLKEREESLSAQGATASGVSRAGTARFQAHVLLVEDNEINQEVLSLQIQKTGCTLEIASSGRESLEMLAGKNYSLVFMDCQMPEMSGYDVAREIRRREGKTRHMPIIALTAHAMSGDREKCLAAGMDDYLSKPVREAELQKAMKRWLPDTLAGNEGGTTAENQVPPSSHVDMEILNEASGGTKERMKSLIQHYLRHTEGLLKELRSAIQSGDAKGIANLAHKAAGSSAMCGMVIMVAPLRELENIGNEKQLLLADPAMARAEAAFKELNDFLQKFINAPNFAQSDS